MVLRFLFAVEKSLKLAALVVAGVLVSINHIPSGPLESEQLMETGLITM
jgi:hypothetical protein